KRVVRGRRLWAWIQARAGGGRVSCALAPGRRSRRTPLLVDDEGNGAEASGVLRRVTGDWRAARHTLGLRFGRTAAGIQAGGRALHALGLFRVQILVGF